VAVWHLGADGPVEVECASDSCAKTVTFKTNHLSIFAVGQAAGNVRVRLAIGQLSYTVNGAGRLLDAAPDIIGGRTMVPLRFIAEALGAKVDWNGESMTATVELDGGLLAVTIDEAAPGMDVPAMLVNGRTMVPLRYISEGLGCDVKWNDARRTVDVTR
jgi:hypothetical protein